MVSSVLLFVSSDAFIPYNGVPMSRFWAVSFFSGLAVAILAGPVLSAFPESGHSVNPRYGSPVFAFEMAKSASDLESIFGPVEDPERPKRIQEMDRGNLLDYPFMAFYSLFMAAFALSVWRDSRHAPWVVLAYIGLLSGVADAIENVLLLNITNDLDSDFFLVWLAIPVWTKFFAIMCCIIASSCHIFDRAEWWWKTVGALGIVGGSSLFIAFLSPPNYGFLVSYGTAVGWLGMLAFAGERTFAFFRHRNS